MVVVTTDGLRKNAEILNHVDASTYWGWMATASSAIAEATVQTMTDWITTDTTGFTENTASNGLQRAAATCTYEANYKSVWYHVFTASSGVTVRSVAITNSGTRAGSKGLLYHLFSADKVMAANDTLTVTMKLTQSY